MSPADLLDPNGINEVSFDMQDIMRQKIRDIDPEN